MRTLIVVAIVCLRATAQAQQDAIGPGARVRVEVPHLFTGRAVGTIMSRTIDTIVVAVPRRGPAPERSSVVRYYAAPQTAFTRIEVSEGRSRALGAGRGALVGLVLGLALSTAIMSEVENNPGEGAEIGVIMALSAPWVVSFVGAGFGFLLGAERWVRVHR
jgi:hypothetical protein